jgi:hypothetical protein
LTDPILTTVADAASSKRIFQPYQVTSRLVESAARDSECVEVDVSSARALEAIAKLANKRQAHVHRTPTLVAP